MSSSSPDERSGRPADHGGRRMGWIVALGVVFAIALVGVIIFLHVTGRVGPGAH